jgi:hypothetical protein
VLGYQFRKMCGHLPQAKIFSVLIINERTQRRFTKRTPRWGYT